MQKTQVAPTVNSVGLEWKRGDGVVSWKGAYEYCEKLRKDEGKSWRLASALEIQRHFSVGSDSPSSDNYVWSALFNEKGVHYTVNLDNGAKQWRGDEVVRAEILCVSGNTWDRDAWIAEAYNARVMDRIPHMVDVVKKEAEKNNPVAQLEFGNLYIDGLGVPQDDMTALEWYKKAVANGSREAQFNISEMHRVGRASPDAGSASTEPNYKTSTSEPVQMAREQHEKNKNELMQDTVYAQAYRTVSSFRNSALCQNYSRIILQWASPKAGSEDFRAQAVERVIDKVPDHCFQ